MPLFLSSISAVATTLTTIKNYWYARDVLTFVLHAMAHQAFASNVHLFTTPIRKSAFPVIQIAFNAMGELESVLTVVRDYFQRD